MSLKTPEQIAAQPAFVELTSKRLRLGILLSLAVLAFYFVFVFMCVLTPDTIATPTSEGGKVPFGLPLGFGVIIFSFAVTGVYVIRANSELDVLNRKIVEDNR